MSVMVAAQFINGPWNGSMRQVPKDKLRFRVPPTGRKQGEYLAVPTFPNDPRAYSWVPEA